jgi:quercetin dioxygenase-like cupin family protein
MNRARVIHDADAEPESWSDPFRGEVAFRTLFGRADTRTSFTAGVTDLETGGWLGLHRHGPAEIYYVLTGEGTLTIDGEDHAVSAGTAAYIPGDSEHGIRNTGIGCLRFFYAFAVGSFDDIEYRFTAQQSSHQVPDMGNRHRA